MNTTNNKRNGSDPLFEYLLRLADDRLIMGHRLSEWCGHAPVLEEDIAMANMALDYLGQATHLLEYASQLSDIWKNADQLAYLRDDRKYHNIKMVELPNNDFAFTMTREFLFSVYSKLLHRQLQLSKDAQLAGMAAKAYKEDIYHFRHSRDWMLRLGDGTEESHKRLQDAVDEIWTYTGELFYMDDADESVIERGIGIDLEAIRPEWNAVVNNTFADATIDLPDNHQYMANGGRAGLHTEHLGHVLDEMQFLTRSHPDAKW